MLRVGSLQTIVNIDIFALPNVPTQSPRGYFRRNQIFVHVAVNYVYPIMVHFTHIILLHI